MATQPDQTNPLFRLDFSPSIQRRPRYDKSIRMSDFAAENLFNTWYEDASGATSIPKDVVKGRVFSEYQYSYGPSFLFSSTATTPPSELYLDMPVIRISSHSDSALSWNDCFDGNVCTYVMPANSDIPMRLPVENAILNRGKSALLVLDVAPFALSEARELYDANRAVSGSIYYKHVCIDLQYDGGAKCKLFVPPRPN